MDDDAGDVGGVEVVRMALDADVLEPVRGPPRLEDLAGDAGGHHLVDLAGRQRLGEERHRRAEVVGGDVAVRSSHSPWVSVTVVPAGPRSVSRTQPLMFWPRSTICRSASSRVTETGTISSTRRTGGAGESTSPA